MRTRLAFVALLLVFCQSVSLAASAGRSGDLNLDGSVNALDIDILAADLRSGATIFSSPTSILDDVNGDGLITHVDLDRLVGALVDINGGGAGGAHGTHYGDADLVDSAVTAADVTIVKQNFGSTGSNAKWANGNFYAGTHNDTVVGQFDVVTAVQNFGKTGPSGGTPFQPVPQPSTSLSARLVATPDGTTAGLYHVAIQVQSNGTPLGVSGMQFDILSSGHGLSAPVPQGAGVDANSAKTNWTISSSDFTEILPEKLDGISADSPGNAAFDGDSDQDAIFGSFFSTGHTNTSVGMGSFQTVATEDWQLTNPLVGDTLNLVITEPTFYDLSASDSNSQLLYGLTIESGAALIAVPEPAAWMLFSAGAIAMVCVRRRAIRR